MSGRDNGVKKNGKTETTKASARSALDALDRANPRSTRKPAGLGDGFVGTAGRETRGDAHAHAHRGEEDNQRKDDTGAALTREDVIRLLRESNMENALPQLPKIPGWHTCWLSTTNQYDTIPARERLGYIPIEHHELKGFDNAKCHSGDQAGKIVVNEMIAYKVQEDIYQAIMTYCHHDQPNSEAGRITDAVEEIKEVVGRKLVKSAGDDGDLEGFDVLREENSRRAPHFD